jgi:hypothetical protein
LIGTAEDVRPRTSRRRNEYTTFTLTDQSGQISVFSWGKLPIDSGEHVEMHGVFQRVKHVGSYTFANQIDASSVRQAQ